MTTLRQGPPLQENVGKIVAQFNRSKPTWSIGEVAAEGMPWIGTQGHFFVPPPGKKKKDFLSFSFRASLRRAPSVTQARESLEFHCQIQLPFSSNCQRRRLGFLFSRRRNRSNRGTLFLLIMHINFPIEKKEGDVPNRTRQRRGNEKTNKFFHKKE